MESNQLSEFIEKFFKNLGADVNFQGGILFVSNVSSEFEKFYGKKSPYKFTFNSENVASDVEFVDKNSYVMKSISSYLENSGQTTLLKIDFEIDPIAELTKRFEFVNSHLVKLTPKKRHGFLFRFSFNTTFQYLNEKEKVINDIYVYDGKIVDGNLNNYPVLEGDKKEVQIPDMKEPYFIAKDDLKIQIKKKTEEVAEELAGRLELERERIETHFVQEIREYEDNLKRAVDRLSEVIREGDSEKISRQKKLIDSLKEKMNFFELEKDKERALELEKQKHMLNVNNKLFNTTLIYYPLFTYDAILKSVHTKRVIELCFNPLINAIKPVNCENCNAETSKLFLCATGHVTCEKCSIVCESCNKDYCLKCVKIKCEHCGKMICRDCATRCFRCSKVMCKAHTKFDKVAGRVYCNNCLRRCERCSSLKDPASFRISKRTGAPICEDCFRTEMQSTVLKEVFDE